MYLVIYSTEAQRGGGDVGDRAGCNCTVVEVVEIPCGRDCEIARYDCGTLRSFEGRASYTTVTTCLGGHRLRRFMGISGILEILDLLVN